MAFHSKPAALADIARVAFIVMSYLSAAATQQPVQVMLDDGPYSGVTMAGVNKFLGFDMLPLLNDSHLQLLHL